MKRIFSFLAAFVVFGSLTLHLNAEEKNGFSLTVSKTTLDRSDNRVNLYYSERIDRIQGLKVMIKNTGFKPKPEGELEWTILVRKYDSTLIERYAGKETVKALKPAESQELVVGSAQIMGWKDTYAGATQVKDKIEYQIIVKHDGKETVRTASSSNFEALNKRATSARK